MSEDDEEDSRHFEIDLFIVHPALRPNEISKALNLVAHSSQAVGEPRKTSKGKPLSGVYTDTRWRHKQRYTVDDQWFTDELSRFVGNLRSRGEALAKLQASGGMTTLVVQFLGNGFFGDEIGHETLTAIVELGLSLEIECFAVAQDE